MTYVQGAFHTAMQLKIPTPLHFDFGYREMPIFGKKKKNTSFLIIQNLFYTIYIEYENWRCIFMTSKSFAKPAQVTILKSYDMFSNTCNIYGKQHEAVNQCVWNIYLAEICPMPHPAFMHRRLWQLWVISLFPQK